MLNLNSLLIFSEHPKKLAEFYKKIFQKEPEMIDGDYAGFMVGSSFITIGPHDKVKGDNPNPERIIFNFETKEIEDEFQRIKKLGTQVIKEPYHPSEAEGMLIATFADIDGNYFQLMTPWKPQ